MLNHLRQSWSLKIGLLTHSVNPRGGVVHTLELANALHAAGHEVTVFAPATKGQRMFRPVPFRLQLVQIDVHDRDVPAMVETRINAFERHLTHLLLEEQFDVLHAQDPIGANALANLREQGLIDGFIRTVHHLDRFTDARLHHWQARGMQAASEVLCVSQLWTDSLLRDHNIYARTVQNGVDLNRYKSEPDSEDALLKTRLGLRGGLDAPVILAVGGIEERKNSIRLLQAFSQLRIDFPKAQLVIAGGSSLLNHDRYSAKFFEEMQGLNMAIGKPLGTDADVVVTGPLADIEMPALFRCADVLAMPSLNEGFGLVVLESLACGTPVLVSNIAPFTEYLSDADCVWADPLSHQSIAAALKRALKPTRRSGLKVVPDVCHRFSWQKSASRHADIYHAYLAMRRHPPLFNFSTYGDRHAHHAF